jgi:hypothetical protein
LPEEVGVLDGGTLGVQLDAELVDGVGADAGTVDEEQPLGGSAVGLRNWAWWREGPDAVATP